MGRPKLTDEERKKRKEPQRLARNKRERERRLEIKNEREAAKRILAQGVVREGPTPIGGAAAYVPKNKDRVLVQSLAGLGMRHDEIAIMVVNSATNAPITEETLRRHFATELVRGPIKANSKVGKSLYKQATGAGGAKRSTAAAIFWAKCRMGWRETQHVEVEIKSGVLVAPSGSTPEQWVAAVQQDNKGKAEPGKGGGEA